ncbi:MAG: hypothetical protein AMJ81_14335 [Phycisphaerae bacterium SM23_33]|nr:MAG: hypothetical protein AMJ81_14335 [Phycisphaerae bacterium SM23_33]
MKIRILYDNRALEGYRADWGFACLVQGEEAVLFDTGADPAVLEHNMGAAGVNPSDLHKVVLSHDHWDHTGGVAYAAGGGGPTTVYLLPSFSPETRRSVRARAEVREVADACEVAPGVHSTGPVGRRISEQAVWLDTERGVVLITGCAHPGVDALMYAIRSTKPLYGVLGGFHGFHRFEALRGTPFLAPCHCTEFRSGLAEEFPDSFCDVAAGSELEF